mmetsp:Transcript_23050/g.44830  ORF Transcript_23050/g.44830 Transcript_23050/m.44830 type:complete len:117 (+) Transcript_23050:102-452(+)
MSSQGLLLHALMAILCRLLAWMFSPASSSLSLTSKNTSKGNVGVANVGVAIRSVPAAAEVFKALMPATYHQATSFAIRGALGMLLLLWLPVSAQGATICDHFDCTDTAQTSLDLYG